MVKRSNQLPRTLALMALAAFAWTACRPAGTPRATEESAAGVTAVPLPTETAIPEPTEAPALEPTGTSTPAPAGSPTPLPTEPPTAIATGTATTTPAPEIVAVVTAQFATVFTGPAGVFDDIVTFTIGMELSVTGRSAAGDWLFVDLLLGQGGWISASAVRIEGEVDSLAVLETPEIPSPTPTSGSPPAIVVRDLAIVILQNFKLHENVVITVVQVGSPETAESENCVITIPAGTLCPFFNTNKIGVTYRITAVGDQGSFAETFFTRQE